MFLYPECETETAASGIFSRKPPSYWYFYICCASFLWQLVDLTSVPFVKIVRRRGVVIIVSPLYGLVAPLIACEFPAIHWKIGL